MPWLKRQCLRITLVSLPELKFLFLSALSEATVFTFEEMQEFADVHYRFLTCLLSGATPGGVPYLLLPEASGKANGRVCGDVLVGADNTSG
jgi:hypothetical protein